MNRRVKHFLHTEHPQHTILAFAMMSIGIILLANNRYFFWPPFAVELLNDDLVGGIFLLDGALLLSWAMGTPGKIYANRKLLSITAGLLAFESTAELCHGSIAGRPHMIMAGVLELVILAFVFLIISQSKKNDRN